MGVRRGMKENGKGAEGGGVLDADGGGSLRRDEGTGSLNNGEARGTQFKYRGWNMK